MGIIDDIGRGPVGLDSSVFIYFIEEDARYIDVVQEIFDAIHEGHLIAYTSGITLLETLVIPLRNNNKALANQYTQLLTESKGLTLMDLDQDLLHTAAHLRASLNIKTPDALQIAAAKQGCCTAFVTNDRRLPSVLNLPILQLSEYI